MGPGRITCMGPYGPKTTRSGQQRVKAIYITSAHIQ